MSTKEIIKEIKRLPVKKRMTIIRQAIKSMRESEDKQLEKASSALLKDYNTDRALTAFTALDFEKFYEAR